jgi:hypothetical protein
MWEAEEFDSNNNLFSEYLLDYVPEKLEPMCFPTENEFSNIISMLPSWKAAGPDRIFNFFIKKISSLHSHLYNVIKEICLKEESSEEWFYKGITGKFPLSAVLKIICRLKNYLPF